MVRGGLLAPSLALEFRFKHKAELFYVSNTKLRCCLLSNSEFIDDPFHFQKTTEFLKKKETIFAPASAGARSYLVPAIFFLNLP